MSGETWMKLLVVAIGLAGGGVMVVISYMLRTRCPACRKATLELDLTTNAGGIDQGTNAKMFRCTSCSAEYRRHPEGGPFIPRSAWEAGAREELPKVHALRRGRRPR